MEECLAYWSSSVDICGADEHICLEIQVMEELCMSQQGDKRKEKSEAEFGHESPVMNMPMKMKTCGLLPGWYGLTSQDLLTALQMFQNPDQLQDNWLKDEASQTAPVKIGPSS
ncbi:hypothetical protein STEG23_017292 [Scotinomys teguina]